MTTLRVEQFGEDLVIRLTPEMRGDLDLHLGDEVRLERSLYGEVSLVCAEMDHQLRHERGRAYLKRLRAG